MALFQRKPQTSDPVNYVTVGLSKTLLIVGLGNPGKEYDLTRHNIGFMCVDEFVAKNSESFSTGWTEKKDLKCQLATGQFSDTRVLVIKPTTFMNNSGEAVQAVMHFYKIPLDNLVVVYDEIDINFGDIRTRLGGSSAGHNGVKSILQHIDEKFGRVRIGIGPKKPARMSTANFVLAKFSAEEQEHLAPLKREVTAILSETAYGSPLQSETRNFII